MPKPQQGFLLIVAITTILIVGFVIGVVAYIYTGSTKSNTNTIRANQAFYIALSGLEIAKHDLLKPGTTLTCSDITNNSKYTNICFPPESSMCQGYFTVTGDETTETTQLLAPITSPTTTTIRVNNISGLLPEGIVVIDNEAIWYSGITSGSGWWGGGYLQLQNVNRGTLNTQATTHNQGATVTQNVCALTATASIPSIIKPHEKRVIQEFLWKNRVNSGEDLGVPNNPIPDGITPSLISAQTISLANNATVRNPLVTLNGSNFTGSTIVSAANVNLKNNAKTKVGTNNTTASTSKHYRADIMQHNNNITTVGDALWHHFFTQSKASIEASSTKVNNCSAYDYANASGTVWFNCDFSPPNNITIGSTDNPVTLIVNGNINSNSNAMVNGFIYVMHEFSPGGTFEINGLIVAEGAINLRNNVDINFNSAVLSALGLLTETKYSKYFISKEVFN